MSLADLHRYFKNDVRFVEKTDPKRKYIESSKIRQKSESACSLLISQFFANFPVEHGNGRVNNYASFMNAYNETWKRNFGLQPSPIPRLSPVSHLPKKQII